MLLEERAQTADMHLAGEVLMVQEEMEIEVLDMVVVEQVEEEVTLIQVEMEYASSNTMHKKKERALGPSLLKA